MTTNSKTAESIVAASESLIALARQVRSDSFHEAGRKIAEAARLVAEAGAEITAFSLAYAENADTDAHDFYYAPNCEKS